MTPIEFVASKDVSRHVAWTQFSPANWVNFGVELHKDIEVDTTILELCAQNLFEDESDMCDV